jgi:hypothetical protein
MTMKIKDIKIVDKGRYHEFYVTGFNNKSKLIAKIIDKKDTLLISFLIHELVKNGVDEEKFSQFIIEFRDRFPFLS